MFIRVFIFAILLFQHAQGQSPFIRLTEPLKENNPTSTARRFIIGSTCKECILTANGQPVPVYPTGAFVVECLLQPGDSAFLLEARSPDKKTSKKTIRWQYRLPAPDTAFTQLNQAWIKTYPEGDLLLRPGDELGFTVKAIPGASVMVMNQVRLYPIPDSITGGVSGYYQANYTIRESDRWNKTPLTYTVTDRAGVTVTKNQATLFTVFADSMPDIALTRGRLAHLEYGLGEDRLGGAKIGYIDSLIRLKLIGKVGTHWKVQLAPSRTAYIPEEHLSLMPKGILSASSLTGKIRVYHDSLFETIDLQLFNRLPYQSFHLTNPSRIVVDVFGATGNTNWIDQPANLKTIGTVDYEQIADGIFRIIIPLQQTQAWGHRIAYEGNHLRIQVRKPPFTKTLQGLVVAVDAGHGGKNTGAVGPTGVVEKELVLAVSKKIQQKLLADGAKVIMTRNEEAFFDNKERILFYRDSLPDILLSIHLNSASDPLRVGGTASFYRMAGFRPLSRAIQHRMLELGLKDYGNNGSFNFMLNSPTEYPNALVEMLFLSNPAEEMLILDEAFQEKIADKIVMGVRDFMLQAD